MDSPQIPVDPMLATEQQQAQNDLVNSLQNKTQGDMSSLMARYGTQLAIAGIGSGSVSPTTGGIMGPVGGKVA